MDARVALYRTPINIKEQTRVLGWRMKDLLNWDKKQRATKDGGAIESFLLSDPNLFKDAWSESTGMFQGQYQSASAPSTCLRVVCSVPLSTHAMWDITYTGGSPSGVSHNINIEVGYVDQKMGACN